MRITHLHGFNFRSLDDVAVDLSDDGLVALIGAPGSGKSSLLSLVPYVLYGDTGQNGTLVDLRRRGSDDNAHCGGTVTLIHNGDKIVASRWLTRSRPKGRVKETGHASLTINGEAVDGITPTRLTEDITRILGQPKEAFRGANFIGQGEVDTLATATPTEVQALVEHHTGLAPLTRARKKARDAARDATTAAKALPGDQEELARAERELEEAREEAAETQDAADVAVAQRNHARTQLDNATGIARDLRHAVDTARTSRDAVVAATAVADKARSAAAQADAAIADLDVDHSDGADALADQANHLDGALSTLADTGAAYRHALTAADRAANLAAQAHSTVAALDRIALNTAVEQSRQRLEVADTEGRAAAEQAAAADAELQRLTRALRQLEHAEDGAACCPTCRQSVADLAGLIAQFRTEADTCRGQLDKATAARRTAAAAHSKATADLGQAEQALREADQAAKDLARVEADADTAGATAEVHAADMRTAIIAAGGSVDSDCAGKQLLQTGLDAHATAKVSLSKVQAACRSVQAAADAHAAVADADRAVQDAHAAVIDAPDPQKVTDADSQVAQLQVDYDAAADAASRAEKLLSASQVALTQVQSWTDIERDKWTAKSKALQDAEVATGTAEAISALRAELLAEYTGQISASATELLARFGGEHVAFHLDSDFVPRVELMDGALVDTRTLSGGEKARAGLAFRLGITLQITQGGVPDQVLGDEVTNYLDEDGRRAVIAALQQLFPSVVLISHTSEALDFASRTIALDRDPLGATSVQGDDAGSNVQEVWPQAS